MLVALVISALLEGFVPSVAVNETAPRDTVLVLPEDPRANAQYNGSFDHETQVAKGNPDLVQYDGQQNIAGGRAIAHRQSGHQLREFTFYFRRNKTDIDPDYLWNRSQEEDIRGMLRRSTQPDSVVIYAWASPEGHYGHNVWLSQQRAESAQSFILKNSSLSPSLIQIRHQEENWPGLRQAVQQFYEGEDKEDVLDILYREDISDADRLAALKALNGGETYSYLLETLMKPLRSAVIIFYGSDVHVPSAPIKNGLIALPEVVSGPAARPEVVPVEVEPEPEYAKRTIAAVKTNALYDLALAPNYAIEVPVGKHFSVQFEHYFPWWATTKELKYCLQYLTLGGEFRWWFAPQTKPETSRRMIRDALVGHFVGVYGLWGKTDIQWQRQLGMYQCYPVLSAGLTYGYSFPLTKHWNMELSVSAGYARIPYQHYTPSEDWQILWRDRTKEGVLHYFGPTQVKVSLVRPIVIRYRVK